MNFVVRLLQIMWKTRRLVNAQTGCDGLACSKQNAYDWTNVARGNLHFYSLLTGHFRNLNLFIVYSLTVTCTQYVPQNMYLCITVIQATYTTCTICGSTYRIGANYLDVCCKRIEHIRTNCLCCKNHCPKCDCCFCLC